MKQSKKLIITNFNHLAKYFDGTEYSVRAFSTSTDQYGITLLHRTMPGRYVFLINRDGYLTGGEWHYATTIEAGRTAGCVTWDFMKDPNKFVKHILVSIKNF